MHMMVRALLDRENGEYPQRQQYEFARARRCVTSAEMKTNGVCIIFHVDTTDMRGVIELAASRI